MDEDDLTEAELSLLRQKLVQLDQELRAYLSASLEGTRPVDLNEPIGRLSRMEAIQQQQMAQATRHRSMVRLRQVQAAFKRLKSDDFGYCVSCDEPIGRARLEARPETPLCLTCQSALESG